MGILNKIFGTYSEKEVKRIMPQVEKINELEEEMTKLSDNQLKAKTDEFKKRLVDRRNFRRYFSRSICSYKRSIKKSTGHETL